MSFGGNGIEQKHWSEVNLEIALNKMQQEAPTFGPNGNTGEKDGKYFAMGIEITQSLYEKFLDKFEAVSGEMIDRKNDELNKIAA